MADRHSKAFENLVRENLRTIHVRGADEYVFIRHLEEFNSDAALFSHQSHHQPGRELRHEE